MLYRSYKNYLKKISYPKSNVGGFVDAVPPVEVVFPFLNFQPKFELFTSKNVLKPDSSHPSEADVCSYVYQDFSEIHNNSYDFTISSGNEWIWLGEDGHEFESMPPLEPIPGVFHPNSFDSAKLIESGLIHEKETEKGNSEKKVLVGKPVHQPEMTFENDLSSKRKRPECIYGSDKRRCIVSNGETKEKFTQVSISTCSSVGPKDPKSVRINSEVNGNLPSKSLHLNVSASNTTFPKELNESSSIDCISFNHASDLQAFASAMLNKKSRIVRESKEESALCNAWKSKRELLLRNARGTKEGLFSWNSEPANLTSSLQQAKKCFVSQTKGESSSCNVRETKGLCSWDSEPANLTSSLQQAKKLNVSENKGELFLCKMRETKEGFTSWEWWRKGDLLADITTYMQQAQKPNKSLKTETLIKELQEVGKKRYSVITPDSFQTDPEKIPFVTLDSSDEEAIKYDSSEIILEDSSMDGKEPHPVISKPPQADPRFSVHQAQKKCKSVTSKTPTGDHEKKPKRSRRKPKRTIFRNFVPEKIYYLASDLDSPDEEEIKQDPNETFLKISSMYEVIDGKVCDPVVPKLPKADPKPSMAQAQKTNKSKETEAFIEHNRQKVKSGQRPGTTSKSTTPRNLDQGKIPFVALDYDSFDEDKIKHDSSKILLENSLQHEVIDGKECDPVVHKLPKADPKPSIPPGKKTNKSQETKSLIEADLKPSTCQALETNKSLETEALIEADLKPSTCQALENNKSLETEVLIEDNQQKVKLARRRPDTTSKPTTYRNFDPEKIPFVDSDFDSTDEDYDYDSSETISEYSFLSKSEVMKRKEKDQLVDSKPRRSLRIHLRGCMKESEMGGTCSEMCGEPVRRLKS